MDIQGRLYKVQVKTTEFVKNNSMIFSMSRLNPYKKKRLNYFKNEVDLFMLYCLENNYFGLVCFDEVTSSEFILNINELSKKAKNVKYANNFNFDSRIKELINNGKISTRFQDNLSVEKINEIINLKNILPRNELALKFNISVRTLENVFKNYSLYTDTFKKQKIEVNGIIDSGRGWARRLNIGTNRINSIIRYKGLESAKQFILDNYDFSKENNS